MNRHTYYIVQADSVMFVRRNGSGYDIGYGHDKAAHLTLATAHRLYKELCAKRQNGTPRRFPRIVKVTIETKTITDRG